MDRLNVLVWHIHGSYLNALARVDHNWILPVKAGRPEGYGGRGATFDLPANMREVPAAEVRHLDLDVVVMQTPRNLREDALELLSHEQQRLPTLYLEHNVPRPDAVNTRHPFADEPGLLVHVTRFNQLMWDNGPRPTRVIEHSVALDPSITYEGTIARGISVVNGMQARPRIAGYDLFLLARSKVPLDAVGMGTETFGGLGDVPYRELHRLTARYRFLFSPMRYTSLPLAVVEAMSIGMPVVALGTTALPDVIQDGVNGYISTDPDVLVERMKALIADPDLASALGQRARETARERFGLDRFRAEWDAALHAVTNLESAAASAPAELRR